MIDNAFRSVMPRFAKPIAAIYGRLGWTPNHVTTLGFAIAVVASACVAQGWWWAALAVWWLSRLADATDGVFARETGQESDFGAYYDIVLDMAAYGSMVLGFAVARPDLAARWLAMLFLYVLCITSALALGMEEGKRGLPPRDDRGLRLGAGLAEGGETGIAYSVFLLAPVWLEWTTAVWIAVLLVTVVARTLLAWRTLAPPAPSDAAPSDPAASTSFERKSTQTGPPPEV
jgi:phosphatidylglycerophosphate synthase